MFKISISLGCCCCCLVARSYPTLCNPMDCSPPGASVHEIFQARVLVVGCHFLLQGIFIGKFSWGWYTFNFYKCAIHFLEVVGTGFIVPSIYIIYFCVYFFVCVCVLYYTFRISKLGSGSDFEAYFQRLGIASGRVRYTKNRVSHFLYFGYKALNPHYFVRNSVI